MSNIFPLGKAAKKVVETLRVVSGEPAGSPLVWSQLRGSVVRLEDHQQEKMDETQWQAFRAKRVAAGKNKITEGIELIRKGASADDATEYLIEKLKGMGRHSTVGSEEF